MLKHWMVLSLTTLLMLSACNAPIYNQTESNVADVRDRVHTAVKNDDEKAKPQPSLVVKNGLYVDTTPISLVQQPAWLKSNVIIRGDQLPFSYYSRTVASGTCFLVQGNRLVSNRHVFCPWSNSDFDEPMQEISAEYRKTGTNLVFFSRLWIYPGGAEVYRDRGRPAEMKQDAPLEELFYPPLWRTDGPSPTLRLAGAGIGSARWIDTDKTGFGCRVATLRRTR